MGAALRFRQADVPRQASEKVRLKVVHGPDSGAVYVLNELRATIGRGEDCDVVISDLRASRKHAEISFTNNQWVIRDLGSANGISHNGKSTRSATVRTGDTVTLGETTFQFFGQEVGTVILRAVPRPLESIQADEAVLQSQREKVRQLARFGDSSKPAPKSSRPVEAKNSRPVLLFAAAAITAFVFFSTSDQPITRRKPIPPKNLAEFLPQTTDDSLNKSAETFLKSGFREYRERNYLRARTQFETVLQIAPGNSLAHLYLENCNNAINDEVKDELERGKRAYEGGSLKQAEIHYESVMRLLFRDQSNPSFIEARDQLAAVKKDEETGDE